MKKKTFHVCVCVYIIHIFSVNFQIFIFFYYSIANDISMQMHTKYMHYTTTDVICNAVQMTETLFSVLCSTADGVNIPHGVNICTALQMTSVVV